MRSVVIKNVSFHLCIRAFIIVEHALSLVLFVNCSFFLLPFVLQFLVGHALHFRFITMDWCALNFSFDTMDVCALNFSFNTMDLSARDFSFITMD